MAWIPASDPEHTRIARARTLARVRRRRVERGSRETRSPISRLSPADAAGEYFRLWIAGKAKTTIANQCSDVVLFGRYGDRSFGVLATIEDLVRTGRASRPRIVADLRAWRDEITDRYAPQTARRHVATLRNLLVVIEKHEAWATEAIVALA